MPVIFIPALLRNLTGGQERISVRGATLAEALTALDEQYPGLRAQLIEGDRIRPELSVAIDNETTEGWLWTRLDESSEIHFVQPLSGG